MLQTNLNRSRNDKFILILDLPNGLKNLYDPSATDFFNIEPLQLSIYGSPVPPINIPSINVPFGGQVYKASSNSRPEYDPLNIKFLVDNGYKNYWLLWNWLNLFNDAKTSQTSLTKSSDPFSINEDVKLLNPMSNFTSNFSIFGLDEYNNRIISFTYKNAFPTRLGQLNFSNQDPSEINCDITFVFNQLTVELVKSVDAQDC